MYDRGINLISFKNIDDLKKVAINLNIKGKCAMCYTPILGYKPKNPNDCVYFKYTVFTDNNKNCYLLPSSSSVYEVYNEIGIKSGTVGLNQSLIIDEDNLEVKKMKKIFEEYAYKSIMLENYEKYKTLNSNKQLSFYGLDYTILVFDGDKETISFEDSIIELNLRSHVERNRFAMFEVLAEKKIIICYDEYGRLFAFGFADEKNLCEAIGRLYLAGFKQGFTKNCLSYKFNGQYKIEDGSINLK